MIRLKKNRTYVWPFAKIRCLLGSRNRSQTNQLYQRRKHQSTNVIYRTKLWSYRSSIVAKNKEWWYFKCCPLFCIILILVIDSQIFYNTPCNTLFQVLTKLRKLLGSGKAKLPHSLYTWVYCVVLYFSYNYLQGLGTTVII